MIKQKMKFPWILFICGVLVNRVMTVKILKFTDNREDDTGAKLITTPGQDVQVTDLTFCLDVFVTLIRTFQVVSTKELDDLTVYVPESLDSIQVKFKGIWYIAYNNLVEPYNWGTFCFSYDTLDESVTKAPKP